MPMKIKPIIDVCAIISSYCIFMLILIVGFLFIVCHVSHTDHDGGKWYSCLSNIKYLS